MTQNTCTFQCLYRWKKIRLCLHNLSFVLLWVSPLFCKKLYVCGRHWYIGFINAFTGKNNVLQHWFSSIIYVISYIPCLLTSPGWSCAWVAYFFLFNIRGFPSVKAIFNVRSSLDNNKIIAFSSLMCDLETELFW